MLGLDGRRVELVRQLGARLEHHLGLHRVGAEPSPVLVGTGHRRQELFDLRVRDPEGRKHAVDDAFVVLEEREQQVLRSDGLVAEALGFFRGDLLDKLAGMTQTGRHENTS